MITECTSSMVEEKIHFTVHRKSFPADILTPVACYLKIRDVFPCSVLLESSEYMDPENNYSFICFDPLYTLEIKDHRVKISGKDRVLIDDSTGEKQVVALLDEFARFFRTSGSDHPGGIYGYTSFDAVSYFDKTTVHKEKICGIPDLCYSFYRYIIRFSHFSDSAEIFEFTEENADPSLENILNILHNKLPGLFSFQAIGQPESLTEESEFLNMVESAKEHCRQGDVFQLVLSRRFIQNYSGDEFMVYRALRSISPSPYLFYFDFGNFKLFGASPESQLKISGSRAEICPIAGTFRRKNDKESDKILAEMLLNDPKENAEHIMLVDLARNDLNRYCSNVKVGKLKEVHFYSHVVHMTSEISGEIKKDITASQLSAGVFPAGTLSGAPKIKAIELIARYEKHAREFYGGAIGYYRSDGSCNHAIMIRSAIAIDGQLHYQAGAGIVIDSIPQNELNEIGNKISPMKFAIAHANKQTI